MTRLASIGAHSPSAELSPCGLCALCCLPLYSTNLSISAEFSKNFADVAPKAAGSVAAFALLGRLMGCSAMTMNLSLTR